MDIYPSSRMHRIPLARGRERGGGEGVRQDHRNNFKHISHQFEYVLKDGALATTLSPTPLPPAGEGSGAHARFRGESNRVAPFCITLAHQKI